MTHGIRKLVTIVTEVGLERELVKEMDAAGASGYTITDARGRGGRGQRSAVWEHNTNVRIEIICGVMVAERITERLRTHYYDNYAMVVWMQDVSVFRAEKFA